MVIKVIENEIPANRRRNFLSGKMSMNTHNTWVGSGFGKSRGMKELSFVNRTSTGLCSTERPMSGS